MARTPDFLRPEDGLNSPSTLRKGQGKNGPKGGFRFDRRHPPAHCGNQTRCQLGLRDARLGCGILARLTPERSPSRKELDACAELSRDGRRGDFPPQNRQANGQSAAGCLLVNPKNPSVEFEVLRPTTCITELRPSVTVISAPTCSGNSLWFLAPLLLVAGQKPFDYLAVGSRTY